MKYWQNFILHDRFIYYFVTKKNSQRKGFDFVHNLSNKIMKRSDTFLLANEDLWKKHFVEQGYCILSNLIDENTYHEAISGCEELVNELVNRLNLGKFV